MDFQCSAAAWKAEYRALAHPCRGPALGDGFALGIKAHGIGAVGMQVAKQAALPAAERVVGHGHRQGHVHTHHAHLNVVGEMAGGFAIAREEIGRATSNSSHRCTSRMPSSA